MAAVEVRPSARRVASKRLGRLAADRDDPLLAALAHHAHETVVQVDRATLEADRLRHAEARPVQQLDERAVAQRARADAASISRSASPGESVFGSRRGRRARAMSAAGLSCRWPSS